MSLEASQATIVDDIEYIPLEKLLERARELVPELIELIERRSGRRPLVAVALLEYAAGAVVDATAHGLGVSLELERFYDDLALVRKHVMAWDPSLSKKQGETQ